MQTLSELKKAKHIGPKDIKRLAKKPDDFVSVLHYNPEPFFTNSYNISHIISNNALMKHTGFRHVFMHAFMKYFIAGLDHGDNLNRFWYYGTPEIKVFASAKKYLASKLQIVAVDTFYNNMQHFSGPAKKMILDQVVDVYRSDQQRLVQLVKEHATLLSPHTIKNIFNHLKDGENNPDIIKVINKSKKIRTALFTTEDLEDDDKRFDLLRNIASTPTSLKYLRCPAEFSHEDIKKLAPVMRFKLLKTLHGPKLRWGDKYYLNDSYYNTPTRIKSRVSNKEIKTGLNKIKIPDFTDEQLKELLFAVSLKKNMEVTTFLDKLDIYQQVITRPEPKSKYGFSTYQW